MQNNKFTIDLMQEEDLSEVAQIEAAVFSQPWSEKAFYDSLHDKNTLYLSVKNSENRVVGYCGLLQSFDEADITNVAVEETCRGQHIARQMLTKLMELGNERGITAFTLEVRKSNLQAITLYEHLGFENCGIRKNFYEKPREDAVIYWKR